MKVLKRLIPVFIILVLLLGAYQWMGSRTDVPVEMDKVASGKIDASAVSSRSAQNAILIVTSPVAQRVINDRLSAIGTGRALTSVAVTPWSSGTIEKIFVQAGSRVKISDPVVKLDSDVEEIAVEKARVALHDAELAYARTVKLRSSNTATEVQEINARLTLDNAKLVLRDAQLSLDRRTVNSPINGIVGILPVDPGNYVTTDTTIARIDDRSKLLVDIWVPERFAPLVHIGDKMTALSIARPGEVFDGRISAIDNMIDAESRTLRVRAEIDNSKDILRAGMSFSVVMQFPGDPYPTVDPLAIQWNGKGAYVWRVNGDKVERVPVSIVQRNTNSVLVNAALKVGDEVAIQGVQNLHQDSVVRVKKTDKAAVE